MNRMKDVPLHLRLLAAFGVTDESFALFTITEEKKASIFYFLGMITVTYSSWVFGTALGCIAMQFLPELVSKSLNITLYAMFIGLLAPNLKGNLRLVFVVLITAGISFLLRLFLDSAWTIICATLVGAVVGVPIMGNSAKCDETQEVPQ
jgi:predicted branched-subunit amino acid permease